MTSTATVARRYVEEHNQAGYLALHDELVAADVTAYYAIPGTPQPMDREGCKQLVAGFRAAFPDIHSTVEDVIVDGDRAFVRWSGGGTHNGDLMGIPATGKPVTTTGMYQFQVRDGKIVAFWMQVDLLSVLQQIGAVPAPGAGAPA
jgi:steroid delta-isomerase-like uncharacterized protein